MPISAEGIYLWITEVQIGLFVLFVTVNITASETGKAKLTENKLLTAAKGSRYVNIL